jgi:hypothetical protein
VINRYKHIPIDIVYIYYGLWSHVTLVTLFSIHDAKCKHDILSPLTTARASTKEFGAVHMQQQRMQNWLTTMGPGGMTLLLSVHPLEQ